MINTNKLETGPKTGRTRYLQTGSQNQPTMVSIIEFEIIKKSFMG